MDGAHARPQSVREVSALRRRGAGTPFLHQRRAETGELIGMGTSLPGWQLRLRPQSDSEREQAGDGEGGHEDLGHAVHRILDIELRDEGRVPRVHEANEDVVRDDELYRHVELVHRIRGERDRDARAAREEDVQGVGRGRGEVVGDELLGDADELKRVDGVNYGGGCSRANRYGSQQAALAASTSARAFDLLLSAHP